jgi:hypothetical protein
MGWCTYSIGLGARMVDKTAESDWFSWRRLAYVTLGALALSTAIDALQPDISFLLNLFFVAPMSIVTSAYLLIRAVFGKNRDRYRRSILALVIFWVASTSLFVYSSAHPTTIRSATRWLVLSRNYKQEVLAQPSPENGDFRHIEWDGWGFAGIDTTVFLVFDPTDSLAEVARIGQSGKFKGIPCEVYQVHRLESQWYTVIYDTGPVHWDRCN